MELKVDFNVNLNGTSYHNVNYLCSKNVLVELFGEPISPDDSKTKYEWDFIIKDDDGNEYVACLYDYKNGDFKDNEIIKWHIGSKDSRIAFMLVDLINEKLIYGIEPGMGFRVYIECEDGKDLEFERTEYNDEDEFDDNE